MTAKVHVSKLFFTSSVLLIIFSAAATSSGGGIAYDQCKDSAQSLTARFNYYSTGFGNLDSKKDDSLYLTLRGNGEVQAVLYDPPSMVTSVRRGELPTGEVGQLLARFREALDAAARHKADETIIREGDSFFLTFACGPGRAGELAGRVEDWPESVKLLVKDLRSLPTRLNPDSLSYGYIRAVRVEKNRLESILRGGQVRFQSIEDYPPDLRPVITKVVECPLDFHDVSRKDLDRLLALPLTITHNGFSYELLPFLSKAPPNPDR